MVIARDVDEEFHLAEEQPLALEVSFPPPSHTRAGMVASIMLEGDKPEEELKLDCHRRAESNKTKVEGILTTMTFCVQNMELGDID